MRWYRNDLSLKRLDAKATEEKRRPGRIRADESLTCSLGPVLDISDSGLRICTSKNQTPEAGVRLLMTLFGPDGEFSCACEVRWVRNQGCFARQVGLKFADESAAFRARLRKFVSPCMDMRAFAPDDARSSRESA